MRTIKAWAIVNRKGDIFYSVFPPAVNKIDLLELQKQLSIYEKKEIAKLATEYISKPNKIVKVEIKILK